MSTEEPLLVAGVSDHGTINSDKEVLDLESKTYDKQEFDIDFNIASDHKFALCCCIIDHFKWFYCILQYMPMWTVQLPNLTNQILHPRSRLLNIIFLFLIVVFLGYISFVWMIWNGRFHQESSIGYVRTALFTVIYSLWQLLFLSTRYCGALHFANCICFQCKYCKRNIKKKYDINDDIKDGNPVDLTAKYGFHYNWLYGGVYSNKYNECKLYYSQQSKHTNKVILCFFVVYILCMFCHSSTYYYYDALQHSWIEGASDAISVFFLWIPNCLTQICPMLILLKYQLSLFTLNVYLKKEKSTSIVLDLYMKLFNAFRKDIEFWVYYVSVQTFCFGLHTWSNINELFHNNLDWFNAFHIVICIPYYSAPVIFLIVISHQLSIEFKSFMKRVSYQMTTDHSSLQLYSYVSENELIFKITGIELNYWNLSKLSIAFITSKAAAYSFTNVT